MKKILGLLALTLMLTACDDGELTVETIDFSTVNPVKCSFNNVIYKLEGSQILALELPDDDDFEAAFLNDPTPVGSPRIVYLSATNRLVYRTYNGPVSTVNICSTIPAATPSVTEEWTATAGRMEITTTLVRVTDATTNATTITKYNHNIVFKDITFNKPGGDQIHETFPFGTYQTNATTLPFAFDPDAVQKCPSADVVYNISGSEGFVLTIPSALYPNTVGTQTALVSATNKVAYKLFNGPLPAGYFCAATAPATPTVNQEWNAEYGLANVSGIIEVVTTTESANSYRHYIHLKNVTLKKGNSTFNLGDDYEYGSFVTSN